MIPKTEVLCIVPAHMCIVASEQEGGVNGLATKIAIERAKGEDSYFFPYVAYLPTVILPPLYYLPTIFPTPL